MCSGCSTFTSQTPPPPPVTITDECARLGKPVALPEPVEGVDLGDIAADNRAALVTANKRIIGRDKCEAKVRAGFAQGAK